MGRSWITIKDIETSEAMALSARAGLCLHGQSRKHNSIHHMVCYILEITARDGFLLTDFFISNESPFQVCNLVLKIEIHLKNLI